MKTEKTTKIINYKEGRIHRTHEGGIPLYETLEEKMPNILKEMKNNAYFPQICGTYAMIVEICIDEGDTVGFSCWRADHSGNFILIKIYILEKYRGNDLFYEHYKDMASLIKKSFGGEIFIDTPNHFLIKSLMKHEEYICVGEEDEQDLIIFKNVTFCFQVLSTISDNYSLKEECWMYFETHIFDFKRYFVVAYNPDGIPFVAPTSDVDIPYAGLSAFVGINVEELGSYNKLLKKYTNGY